MPLYDYKCNKCEHIFEELVRDPTSLNPPCTECNSETEKLIGLSSFRLKGQGWYATDYKNNSKKS